VLQIEISETENRIISETKEILKELSDKQSEQLKKDNLYEKE
jgi:hypothetical protein